MDDYSEHSKKAKRSPYRSCFHLTLIQWELLPPMLRRIVYCLVLWAAFLLFIALVDAGFGGRPRQLLPTLHPAQNFTVVINTYQRPAQLRAAVEHYATTCGTEYGVDHVYVLWAEEDVDPPERILPLSSTTEFSSPVSIRRVPNSLNSRFFDIPGVESGPIFMVDDDILASCRSLNMAFDAWKAYPDSMVGFYPRLAVSTPNGGFEYHCWPWVYWRQEMNMILTKACFLHSRFLQLYSSSTTHPAAIREYVDEHMNCEDVAMSLLVANVTSAESPTGLPSRAIYVEGSVIDKGLFNGISLGSGHMHQRADCLREMTHIYRQHGWYKSRSHPMLHRFALPKSTWVQHVPGFGWQTRPSNIFEWFSLGNVLRYVWVF